MAARIFTLSKTRPLVVHGPCRIVKVGSNQVIVIPTEWRAHLDAPAECGQNDPPDSPPAQTAIGTSGESAKTLV